MGRKPKVPKVIVRPLPGDIGGLASKKDNTIELDPNIVGAKENLRVLRNTLEAMENAGEAALEDVRRISASVEESAPEDDAL